MSIREEALYVAAGVLAVLVVASTVGAILKRVVAGGAPHAELDNLNARINAWWVMAAVVGLALAGGKAGVTALFALVSFIALREYLAQAPALRAGRGAQALAFFVVLPLQYLMVWSGWYGMYFFIPIYAFLILPLAAAFSADPRSHHKRSATMQWGLMICVYGVSHVPALLTLDVPGYEGRNALLVLYLILVVQASDVLQYVWGKLIGRHRIAPLVSPSKTVEGFAGGIATAVTLGAALWWITPFTPIESALVSLAITLTGFIGGLVMSAVKRGRGIKDWGTLIVGHGGMLDRIDSLCFSAPVCLHIVRYWWAP